MELVKDATKLTSKIDSVLKTYHNNGRQVHVCVVSALYHAATTGDPGPLTRIYNGLRSNDQQAMKDYIRRAHAVIGLGGELPDGRESTEIVAAVEAGQVLKLEKKEFIVVNGHTSSQAKALAKLSTDKLINPDGTNHKYVLDRNNFAELKTFGDAEALAALVKVGKTIRDGDTDKTKVNVSDKVRKMILKVADEAEAMKSQNDLAA